MTKTGPRLAGDDWGRRVRGDFGARWGGLDGTKNRNWWGRAQTCDYGKGSGSSNNELQRKSKEECNMLRKWGNHGKIWGSKASA